MPTLSEEDLQLDVLPDPADFRDRLFEPTLIEVPPRLDPERYREARVPVLDQGSQGSCTGHALATVAHFLLRKRRVDPDPRQVSPRMLYEMAKRYDEWEGEEYSGSSARGAMKGWHKHGVCSERRWPYEDPDSELDGDRAQSAVKRPLGAYYRVNHRDLVAMHCALAEVEILFATAVIHSGWLRPDGAGRIPEGRELGGHAFAIVSYDADGFWVQNSWGDRWGLGGLALVTYDDWLQHGMDVWVARLGVPLHLETASGAAVTVASAGAKTAAYTFRELRPHVVRIDARGKLQASGTYGTGRADLERLFRRELPEQTAGWKRRRVLIYAHGGLASETDAVQRVADYRAALLAAEVFPVALVWRTELRAAIANLLRQTLERRRPEGSIGADKEFLLDRLDDAVEPLARSRGGKALWDEVKASALAATLDEEGAGRVLAGELARLARQPRVELHFAAHSAGAILLAPLLRLLSARGKIAGGPLAGVRGHGLVAHTCTLWAPACTLALAAETYLPAVRDRGIRRFALFNLTDHAERDDDCADVYHKSLLYLVARAFEESLRIPLVGRQAGERPGTPLLGMERFVRADPAWRRLFAGKSDRVELVLGPNDLGIEGAGPADDPRRRPRHASSARHHADFEDDLPTVRSTLARILGAEPQAATIEFQRSGEKLTKIRKQLPD